MSSSCKICTRPVKSDGYLPCNGFCGNLFHVKCALITTYDADLVKQKDFILFMCKECRHEMKSVSDAIQLLRKSVENNTKILLKQEQNVNQVMQAVKKISEKNVEGKTESKSSYADILKSTVIVKPKQKQDNTITKSEVKQKVNPPELSLKINSVSNRQNGAIAIQCSDEESVKKLESEMRGKLGEKYEVKVPQVKIPQVLVTGMSEAWNEKDLEVAIKRQNDIRGNVKCIKCFRGIKNTKLHNAILEFEINDYKKVMEVMKINLGWDRCRVYEYIRIKKCYNCWGFFHRASQCNNSQICAKCGENHDTTSCKVTEFKCNNCLTANSKFGLNLDFKHDCRDNKCPVFLKKIEIEKKRSSV